MRPATEGGIRKGATTEGGRQAGRAMDSGRQADEVTKGGWMTPHRCLDHRRADDTSEHRQAGGGVWVGRRQSTGEPEVESGGAKRQEEGRSR